MMISCDKTKPFVKISDKNILFKCQKVFAQKYYVERRQTEFCTLNETEKNRRPLKNDIFWLKKIFVAMQNQWREKGKSQDIYFKTIKCILYNITSFYVFMFNEKKK